jgi:ribosome biogenesis ATPase
LWDHTLTSASRPHTDIIDSAILRPGRLDKPLYVPLPGPADRAKILATLLRNIPHAADLDLEAIGHDARCNRFRFVYFSIVRFSLLRTRTHRCHHPCSGADLHYLVREASLIALKDALAQHPDMHDPDVCLVPLSLLASH